MRFLLCWQAVDKLNRNSIIMTFRESVKIHPTYNCEMNSRICSWSYQKWRVCWPILQYTYPEFLRNVALILWLQKTDAVRCICALPLNISIFDHNSLSCPSLIFCNKQRMKISPNSSITYPGLRSTSEMIINQCNQIFFFLRSPFLPTRFPNFKTNTSACIFNG